MTRLYNELARWWPLLSPVEEYEEEASFFLTVLSEAGLPSSPSLLELGSGGGCNAFYLKRLFPHVTLTDLSPAMLEVSRGLNPECRHLEGDMRTLRLGCEFDVVFIHDAIDYMTTSDDLRAALETAFIHCKPGGMALFVPDHVRETFAPSTESGGADGEDRALRYLEWIWDPDETDTTTVTHYTCMFREKDGSVRVEHEQHLNGLFSRGEWMRLLTDVGFTAEAIFDPYDRCLFLAHRN